MDIVLNTKFNNARLPKIDVPGFYDDFGPLGGPPSETSLGRTSRDDKPWTYAHSIGWARTANHTAKRATNETSNTAVVDGHAADGVLTTTLAVVPDSGVFGIVFRFHETANHIRFDYNPAYDYFFVREVLNGSSTISDIYTPSRPPSAGDTMRVEMFGASVKTFFNNELAHDLSLTANMGRTRHGFRAETTQVEFADITFDAV